MARGKSSSIRYQKRPAPSRLLGPASGTVPDACGSGLPGSPRRPVLEAVEHRAGAGIGAIEGKLGLHTARVARRGRHPGGTPGGQVVGATDRKGFAAMERVLAPENFVSTVYAKLGIDPGKILYNTQGRPTHIVSDPTPIKELM